MKFVSLLLSAVVLLMCCCACAGNTVQDVPETTAAIETTVPLEAEVFTAADMTGIDHTSGKINFNNIDFSQQPHFTNQLGMDAYFRDCLANRCRNIVFSCEKSAMPQIVASEFCEKYMLAWCNPKIEPGNSGIHYCITITYYPGDNVAWAYLNSDKSTLTEDELLLYDIAVSWLEENITEDMTDYEKCTAIYNYLSGNVLYSNDLLNALNTSFTFDRGITAYGAMVDKLTICQGYADAFDMLTSMLGMECVQIYGFGDNAPHNWNMIKMEDHWYHVDCTYGNAFGVGDNTCSKAYLFASDVQLQKTHRWDRDSFPAAKDDSKYYYTVYDLYVTNEEELESKVGDKLRSGEQADVYIENFTMPQIKDYVQSLGGTYHIREYEGDLILCAWISEE